MAESKDKEGELAYEQERKKYGLTEFKDLDKEFSLGELEASPFILRIVLRRMDERSEFVLKVLSDLIQPDSHIADMHEAESLDDVEKRIVNDTFRKLAYFRKEFLIRELDYNEAQSAALILLFNLEWAKLKPNLLVILAKLRDSWSHEVISSQEYGYFG